MKFYSDDEIGELVVPFDGLRAGDLQQYLPSKLQGTAAGAAFLADAEEIAAVYVPIAKRLQASF